MPFVTLPGVVGKVYVPEEDSGQPKKHPCKDCFHCQMCSAVRCAACRDKRKAQKNPGQSPGFEKTEWEG